jgi:hypothetical protein
MQAQSRVESLLAQKALVQEQIRQLQIKSQLGYTSTVDSASSQEMTAPSPPRTLLLKEVRDDAVPPTSLREAGALQFASSLHQTKNVPYQVAEKERAGLVEKVESQMGYYSCELALQTQLHQEGALAVHQAAESVNKEEVGSDVEDDDGIDEKSYFRINPIGNASSFQIKRCSGRVPDYNREPFPLKLYRILYDAEQNGQDDIISFSADGNSFTIHQPDEFVSKLMPKYFGKPCRKNTFMKQLSLYCFRRVCGGADRGTYYHPSFAKGNLCGCLRIRRKTTAVSSVVAWKKTKTMSASSTTE